MYISCLKPEKFKDYDLISPKIMKKVREIGIAFIVCIFNAILRNLQWKTNQWKTAQIKRIFKPSKPLLHIDQPAYYRFSRKY